MSDERKIVWVLTHPRTPGICCVLDEWEFDARRGGMPPGIIATKTWLLPLDEFLREATKL